MIIVISFVILMIDDLFSTCTLRTHAAVSVYVMCDDNCFRIYYYCNGIKLSFGFSINLGI